MKQTKSNYRMIATCTDDCGWFEKSHNKGPFVICPQCGCSAKKVAARYVYTEDDLGKHTTTIEEKVERYTDHDVAHLQFIHDRMVEVHLEPKNIDYMVKLRKIIEGLRS